MGSGWEMGLGMETADALWDWDGYTLLKTGVRTDRHTKVKTVYLSVSLRLLGVGGYNVNQAGMTPPSHQN